MDEVLMHQPKDVQRQVRKLVRMSGISEGDPYFLILLCCRINQILLQNAPKDLERSFDIGRQSAVKALEGYTQKLKDSQEEYLEQTRKAALDISVSRLDLAIAKVLEDNGIESKKGKFTPRVWGSMIASGTASVALIVGFIAGYSYDKAILGKTNTINYNKDQKVMMQWAQSKEALFAKRLLEWNKDLANQKCQEKVQDLNITIQLGNAKATSGFCTIWTVETDKREFDSGSS